jgi:hypothetical protein
MKRISQIVKPVLMVLAALYLVADAVFMNVAKPLADWIGKHAIFRKLRGWIANLSPYSTLALFCVPLIVLEPAKPISAYLIGTGHIIWGVATFTVAEILKLVLVERLFHISRSKLMSIPVFAWAYGRWRQAVGWFKSTDAWTTVRRVVQKTNFMLRSLVWQIRFKRWSYGG